MQSRNVFIYLGGNVGRVGWRAEFTFPRAREFVTAKQFKPLSLTPRFFIYLGYFISNRDNLNLNGPLVTFLIGCKEFRAMVQPPRLLPGLKPRTAKRRGQDV